MDGHLQVGQTYRMRMKNLGHHQMVCPRGGMREPLAETLRSVLGIWRRDNASEENTMGWRGRASVRGTVGGGEDQESGRGGGPGIWEGERTRNLGLHEMDCGVPVTQ